jgi:MFS family permease
MRSIRLHGSCPGRARVRSVWPHGGLWRHADFLKLWTGETISQFGSQISQLAIPFVAILALDASTFEVASIATVEFLPFLLFTLPAGVWVDRMRRRPILIGGDLGRALLLGSIPIAYFAETLTLGQLYVVGFLAGLCTVFFDVSYMSYLPSLVEREQIIEGNAKMEVTRSAAQIGGPGLGGVLVQLFSAPYAIFVDAVSFVASAAFVWRIRSEEPPVIAAEGGSKPRMRTELREGLSFVLRNPNLRAQAGCTATSNFFSQFAFAILLVYAVRELDLDPGLIGLVLSLGAIGGLVGAVVATRVSTAFGIGPTTIGAAGMFGPAMLLIAIAPKGVAALPFLVTGMLVFGISVVIYNIVQVSYRQAVCPPRLQGRMNSVMRFIVWGTIPLGSLAGGVLASLIGLRPTILVSAVGGSLAVLWIVFSPQRHLREMPPPADDAVGDLSIEAA